MRVFIAGGTGVIGSRLAALLASRGHTVFATTHTQAKSAFIGALGATPVIMNGLDASSVGNSVARAEPDVVVHQMTALGGVPDMRHFDRWFAQTNALRTDGTRHLLSAAEATGVKQFVAQSFTGWNNRRGGPPVTESDPFDNAPLPAQRETLRAIQFLETAVASSSTAGLVLRYGGLYGPGASDMMANMVKRRQIPIIGDGAGVSSFIHADDAAAATAMAIEQGSRGVFNIVDDEPARAADWIPAMAAAMHAKAPMKIPAWLARLVAGDVVVRMMTDAVGASNAKVRRELGWVPKWASWRDGFREALVAADSKSKVA